MAQEWDIKPRGTRCAACDKAFEDRDGIWSALVFDASGYGRADYCGACWTTRDLGITPFSTWQGVYRAPPPKAEEPVKKETAEAMLRRLMEADDAEQANVVYILAVMLERKRTLIERDVQSHDDGRLTRIYEHRKTGETFVVPEPPLRLDQLEHVQQQVIAMLGGGPGTAGRQKEPQEQDTAEAHA